MRQRSIQRGDPFKTMSVSVFTTPPKISTASRDIRSIPLLSSISSFFSPTGWNVNRGRDILPRGHGVRAWNQFKSCSPRRDRKARERGSFPNLIYTHLARKPIPLLFPLTPIFIPDIVIKTHIAIKTRIIEGFSTRVYFERNSLDQVLDE